MYKYPLVPKCYASLKIICYSCCSGPVNSGGFGGEGGFWGSMEPPFGVDLVQRNTGDKLTGTPLSG